MRRLIALELALLLLFPTAGVFAQVKKGGTGRITQYIQVAKGGGDALQICGADCKTTPYVCKTGSAVDRASSDLNVDTTIGVGPGDYSDECISTMGKSNISFVGFGPASTIIRPIVVDPNSVAHGVWDITYASNNIEITGFTIHDDAWPSASEFGSGCAINVNQEHNTGAANPVQCTTTTCSRNIYIHGNVLNGRECGVQLWGMGPALPQTWPSYRIVDNDINGGSFGIGRFDLSWTEIEGNRIKVDPTFCTDPNLVIGPSPNATGQWVNSGVDCAFLSGCTANKLNISSFTGQKNNAYAGQTAIIYDPGGVSCDPLFDPALHPLVKRKIIASDGETTGAVHGLTFDRDLPAVPDATCKVVIEPVENNNYDPARGGAPNNTCTDIDWSKTGPSEVDAPNRYLGLGIVNQPFHGDYNEGTVETFDRFYVRGNRITSVLNRGGSYGGRPCGTFLETGGISIEKESYLGEILNNDISVEINTNLAPMSKTFARTSPAIACTSGVTCCAQDQVGCVMLAGGGGDPTAHMTGAWTEETPIQVAGNTCRIFNNADPDLTIHGFFAEGDINHFETTHGSDGFPPAMDLMGNTAALYQPPVWARRMTSATPPVTTDITDAVRSTTDAGVDAFPDKNANSSMWVGVLNRGLNEITFDIGTVSGLTIKWQYYSTSLGWTDFPASPLFVDGTDAGAGTLRQDGTIRFIMGATYPEVSWGREDFSAAGGGVEKLYWIRALITAGAGNIPTINSISVSSGATYSVAQYEQAKVRLGSNSTNAPSYTGTIGHLGGSALCPAFRSSNVTDIDDTNGGTTFFSATDGVATGGTAGFAEASADLFTVPIDTTFDSLNMTISTTPGGATTRAYTLMDNGVATALTCTIANPATTCTYTGSPVRVLAGHKIDWRQVNTGAVAAATEVIASVCAAP